eukprot:1143611-Pelagomonas_calceolata.AAC.1
MLHSNPVVKGLPQGPAVFKLQEMLRQILKEGTRNEPLQAPQSVSSGIASGRALQAPQYVSSDTATGRALQAPRSVSGDTASVRALAPPAGPIGLQQRQQQQQCQEGGPSHSRQEHDPEKGGGVLNREESEGKQEQREEPGAEPVLGGFPPSSTLLFWPHKRMASRMSGAELCLAAEAQNQKKLLCGIH